MEFVRIDIVTLLTAGVTLFQGFGSCWQSQ
ncbi:hypothetical protein J2046_000189 [Rhizobium petrolearium]|nr:hypothetical protein [Neorhizobium petrolearium]